MNKHIITILIIKHDYGILNTGFGVDLEIMNEEMFLDKSSSYVDQSCVDYSSISQ